MSAPPSQRGMPLRFCASGEGWYGGHLLSSTKRFDAHHQTQSVLCAEAEHFVEHGSPTCGPQNLLQNIVSETLISDRLAAVGPRRGIDASVGDVTFCIITKCTAERKFFLRCAESVDVMVERCSTEGKSTIIEWLIKNSDPDLSEADLLKLMPERLRPIIRIYADAAGRALPESSFEATEQAHLRWLLFLGQDDLIHPETQRVLRHYISEFPRCRFICSAFVDLDDQDLATRGWRHRAPASGFFHCEACVQNLKAIRRDLEIEMALEETRFSRIQDYELSLQIARQEPILLIPEYLYGRRHSSDPQQGDKLKPAELELIRRRFLARFVGEDQRKQVRKTLPTRRAMCIIRTRGSRLELLTEALRSALGQSVPVTVCVVVHHNAATFEIVKWLVNGVSSDVVLLHAPETDRCRGYPLNVGLDYLREHSAGFDLFCFLDDDDILYPLYTERLLLALELTKASLVYGLSNKRIPWNERQIGPLALPSTGLVAGNFIPIHCYLARTDLLISSGARLREDMNYLEDWDFLLSLLGVGDSFGHLPEILCEFRVIGDGNRSVKDNPEHYTDCFERVLARGRAVARGLGLNRFLSDLGNFDFSERAELGASEVAHLVAAREIFAKAEAEDEHD